MVALWGPLSCVATCSLNFYLPASLISTYNVVLFYGGRRAKYVWNWIKFTPTISCVFHGEMWINLLIVSYKVHNRVMTTGEHNPSVDRGVWSQLQGIVPFIGPPEHAAVAGDAGFLCGKAAMLGDTIKGTHHYAREVVAMGRSDGVSAGFCIILYQG